MNALARIFASAIARRVAYVVVALAFAFLFGEAHAGDVHTARGEAYTHAQADKAAAVAWCSASYPNVQGQGPAKNTGFRVEYVDSVTAPLFRSRHTCSRPDGSAIHNDQVWDTHNFPAAQRCIPPKEHDPVTGNCVDPRERCLNKNDTLPSSGTAIYTGPKCVDRCIYGMRPGKSGASSSNGTTIMWGSPGYTGDTCATVDPDPPPLEPKKCNTVPGSQLTMCVKDNGDHCYSASNGRQICWGPGETGVKTDGNVAQGRGPGADTKPPPPSPPPGETLDDTNQPTTTTTTTTTPGGTVINNTTNNWTTNHGTDAGPGNGGEPTDGGGEEPGEEGEGNGIGGNGACESGYMPSGDPVLGATLTELHRVRCQGDKERDENTSDNSTLNGIADGLEDQANGEDREGFIRDVGEGSGPGLSESWVSFGSGSCPEFPPVTIPGTSYTFTAPAAFCSIGAALRTLFILCAYVWALRLVSE